MDQYLSLPDSPALVAGFGRAILFTPDGELLTLTPEEAAHRLRDLPPPILVHAPATFRRLGLKPGPAFDLLDLFAFARPGQSAAPTPIGLARALDHDDPPTALEDQAALLPDLALVLLSHLSRGRDTPANRDAAGLAALMGDAGWLWGSFVMEALGQPNALPAPEALKVWRRLPEFEETALPPPPTAFPVSEAEARARLAAILGSEAEQRPGQADYAGAATAAFLPREVKGDPHLVLAEAGTGTGKTLGYLAPASVWAEKNEGAVWISTYTRHLQRQIEAEVSRVWPDPIQRRQNVVVRKGRENYLCLLNMEDAVNAAATGFLPPQAITLGLIARWAAATEDGDIQGGDLPGWLGELHGAAFIASLADRRGECIHGACPHYKRCFIEHTVRRARTAKLVVANHALVMAQAAWGGLDDATIPGRYVFDEGHHLFDAADGAFSATLSGLETSELRRWLLGGEGTRTRARGIQRRLDDLVVDRPRLLAPLEAALLAAHALPAPGWTARLTEEDAPEMEGVEPRQVNPTEAYLRLMRQQVLARSSAAEGARYRPTIAGPLECDVFPLNEGLDEIAAGLARALGRLAEPLEVLRTRLLARIEDEADDMDSATRLRIEAIARSMDRRAINPLRAWRAMLTTLTEPPPEAGERPTYVSFFRLDRRDANHIFDVGLHRHWLDPTVPFALTLAAPAQGLLVTSATLRDTGAEDAEAAWASAEARVGAPHLPSPAIRAAVASPFDYQGQTRAFIVNDLTPGDIGQLASAFRSLFLASNGGALGLFTAISRLRAVHERIAPALEAAHIPLYAQHVDAMGNATLVDVFRAEEDSCLLGTDAMRDGVDVPGRALRLVVFEKIPWARPDILHRERRTHLSLGDPKAWDDRIARARLRQAFGRLIRRGSDRGVFVILDRQSPTRLMSALPDGVVVRRVGLARAAQETRGFLAGR